METKEITKEKEMMHLADCMASIISQLKEEKKYSAVHTYNSTLNSFKAFSDGDEAKMSIDEVFTAARLKDYDVWLRQKNGKWNTISTYMRTLRAVYNRVCPPGSAEYRPKLFDGVYTRVVSQTKRSLTEDQMRMLLTTDLASLPQDVQRALAYFRLMFFFRGMPFIDLAYLRQQDIQGNSIVYCRHKTGQQMTVRVPKEAQSLLKEYRSKHPDSVYLFPILDETVKDDAELYACYLRALRHFNKGLEKMTALLLPDVKVSSYTARHTWATLAFYQGLLIGVISKALGHSSIKVTETYLKPFENEKVDNANDDLIVSIVRFKERKDYKYLAVQKRFIGIPLLTK